MSTISDNVNQTIGAANNESSCFMNTANTQMHANSIENDQLSADNLIKNLFYLANERPERFEYTNQHGNVVHKAMHYKCVDGSGPNKRISVDLVDFIETTSNN